MTLTRVQEKMAWWKSRQPGLTGVLLIELAMSQGYMKAKQMFSRFTNAQSQQVNPLLLSNFGLLDSKRLVFGALQIKDAFELGPVMLGHGLMLTASTCTGKLTLAMGYCREMLSSEVVEKLVQMVMDELVDQAHGMMENASIPIQQMSLSID
jgi:NRPS condensation-like uncharacterized protein